MAFSVDALVIGGGIGGLTSAIELSPLEAVVVERKEDVGGTASSFSQGGYSFPVGPLGLSFPGYLATYLQGLNLRVPELERRDFQLLAGDIDVVLSRGFERLQKELEELLDLKAGRAISALEALTRKFRGVYSRQGVLYSALGEGPLGREEEAEEYFLPAREFFSSMVEDETLLHLLSSMSPEKSSLSTIGSAYMWNIMTSTGIWYPRGGMQPLLDKFRSATQERATLSPGEGVERISLGGGSYRVETSKRKLEARRLISSADYKRTFLELGDSFPEGPKREAERRRESGSVFSLYLGGDFSKLDRRRVRAHSVLYHPYLDRECEHLSSNSFYSTQVEVAELRDGNISPPGKGVVIIRAPMSYEDCLFGREREYWQFKERAEKELLEVGESLMPGLSSGVEVSSSYTPLDYEEREGRYRGAVRGWLWEDYIAESLVETGLENFSTAGLYSFSLPFLGGFTSSLYSGRMAARRLK